MGQVFHSFKMQAAFSQPARRGRKTLHRWIELLLLLLGLVSPSSEGRLSLYGTEMIPGVEIQVQEDGEGGEFSVVCLVPQTARNEIPVAFVICTPAISGFKLHLPHLPPGCNFLFVDSLMVLGLVDFEVFRKRAGLLQGMWSPGEWLCCRWDFCLITRGKEGVGDFCKQRTFEGEERKILAPELGAVPI